MAIFSLNAVRAALNPWLQKTDEISDTTLWPKLAVRRDLLEGWKILLSMLVSLAIAFMVVMASCSAIGAAWISQSGKTDYIVPRYMAMIAPCPLAVVLPVRYFSWTLLDYKSLQTHLDSGARPRKLREALPSLTAELLPFRDRLAVLAFYMILIPLEPFYWIAATMKSVLRLLRWVFLREGRKTRRQDLSNGASEGIEMA